MSHARARRQGAIAVAAAAAAAACGGGGATTDPPATFSEVTASVVNQGHCGTSSCHGGTLGGYSVTGTRDQLYAALVNAPAAGSKCAASGLLRVAPGKPEESLLYLKLTDPPCGDPMPAVPLDADEVDLVRRWIAAGAPGD